MATTLTPAIRKVILTQVSWETYERLLAEHVESTGTRFVYDQGDLEIMVVSAHHEDLNRTLALLVEVVAEETGKDLCRRGSTTFKREDLQKGFEPDSCFYLERAEAVRGKQQIDLTVDPAPDLVIEIDITSESLSRFPIYAAVGVAEVWRYDGSSLKMFRWESSRLEEIRESAVLPPMTAAEAQRFLEESRRLRSPEWLRSVREWVRANRK